MSRAVSKQKPDCDGNIDPRQVDIDQKPKRRRKSVTRERKPMPEQMKPWLDEARKRKAKRSVYPGVMLEAAPGTYEVVSPFDDEAGWLDMIADAFGTRSRSAMAMFLQHLAALCRETYDHSNQAWKPNERHLNAALAIIHASRPKDELDAMLCAQAVAIHWMQMRAAANLIGGTSGYLDPHTAKACARLSETFVKQVEAIDRRKRKRRTVRQVITVKRETHYHRHVHVEGGGSEIGGRPYVTGEIAGVGKSIEGTCESAECAALPRPNEGGSVVPFPGDPGQTGLPPARRKGRRARG